VRIKADGRRYAATRGSPLNAATRVRSWTDHLHGTKGLFSSDTEPQPHLTQGGQNQMPRRAS
jgi:hypothetical protein